MIYFFLLFCLFFSIVTGNPLDPTIVSGNATFSSSAKALEVLLSDKAMIHWKSFSIAKGETVFFQLPNAASSTLQRVTGKTVSNIQGCLRSNGQLYLLNPNGIVIGPKGRIDAASFVASTLDMQDAAFRMGKEMKLVSRKSGSITHYGIIKASTGSIALIGRKVHAPGQLEAPNGATYLSVGERFFLQPKGEHIFIEAPFEQTVSSSQKEETLPIAYKNSSSLYASAMHCPSGSEANLLKTDQNGRIFFLSTMAAPTLALSKERNHLGVINSQLFYQAKRVADQANLFTWSLLYDQAAFRDLLLISPRCSPFLRSPLLPGEEETIPLNHCY